VEFNILKPRSGNTLKRYRLTEGTFAALFIAQNGFCGICGISESELDEKFSDSDKPADRMLHIDHERLSILGRRKRVRGLLCRDSNFDLEAVIMAPRVIDRNGPFGNAQPPKDPRYDRAALYLRAAPERMSVILGASSDALPSSGSYLIKASERPRPCARCARVMEVAELQALPKDDGSPKKRPRYMCVDEDACKAHQPHAHELRMARLREGRAARKAQRE
jgi:hypothetical protein